MIDHHNHHANADVPVALELPTFQPLTEAEAARLRANLADLGRVIGQIAAVWAPVVRTLVDDLVRSGLIPEPSAETRGETPLQRVICERRTQNHGPNIRQRAPRVLQIGTRR